MRTVNLFTLLFALFLAGCDLTFDATEDYTPVATGSSVFSLLEIQSNPDDALNIIFVPDSSYGDITVTANRQAFLDDLETLIESSYWQNQAYYYNLGKFNYYYMNVNGSVAAPTTGICPNVTWPAEVDTDGAFGDLVLLLHTNTLRDCRWGRKATSEPTSFRTVVHESSHALFDLPDEYCCDGGYRNKPPVMYNSSSACNNDADNASWRNCVSVNASNGTTWWRSEGSYTSNEIMVGGGSSVWEMGPGDWFITADVLGSFGTPSVATPSIYAPTDWVRP